MHAQEMEQVITLMERHGIAAFEFQDERTHITLSRNTGGVISTVAGVTPGQDTTGDVLRSPGVGRLRLSRSVPGETATALPRRVKKDEIVAYLAIGPIIRPVLAERDCTLLALLAQDGALTGYGDPLFSL